MSKSIMFDDKENWKLRFFSFFIPILPFLNIYELNFAPISYGEVLLIFFIIISFNSKLTISNNIYFAFLFYAFTFSIILGILGDYFTISDWLFKWVRIIMYSYTFLFLAKKYINVELISNYFEKIGLVVSIIQIIQASLWYLFHRAIILVLPFLKLHYIISNYGDYLKNIMAYNGTTWRPSGPFLEPADFSLYACICLICCLFLKKKVNLKSALIITASTIMSFSSFGILMTVFIWLYWVIKANKYSNAYKFISILIFLAVLMFLLSNRLIIQSVMYRIGTIGQEGSTTGSLRLLRGLAIYNQLPTIKKIFGVGLGNLATYLIKYNITTPYDLTLKPGNEYMNTISYILVNTGIVGTTIFVSFIVSLFHYFREYYKRILIICWIIICLTNSNFLNIGYVLPLIILYGQYSSRIRR